jgi:hypothetical protein
MLLPARTQLAGILRNGIDDKARNEPMKKYLVPVIILGIVGAGISLRYAITAPAKAAALDLKAINSLTVGQTTEAELLGRSAFQTVDRRCFEGDCVYHTERSNSFLSRVHLAPYIFFYTAVSVRDGVVTRVSVFMTKRGLPPLSMTQTTQLPAGCTSNPCIDRMILPTKKLMGISVMFTNESDLRNRMPEAAQSACLSRLRGCNTYDELMPLAKGLNAEAAAP